MEDRHGHSEQEVYRASGSGGTGHGRNGPEKGQKRCQEEFLGMVRGSGKRWQCEIGNTPLFTYSPVGRAG